MTRSTHQSDIADALRAQSVERVALDSFDESVVSDDDIPWEEIMADLSSGERGIAFEPEHLLKWMEEDEDEE